MYERSDSISMNLLAAGFGVIAKFYYQCFGIDSEWPSFRAQVITHPNVLCSVWRTEEFNDLVFRHSDQAAACQKIIYHAKSSRPFYMMRGAALLLPEFIIERLVMNRILERIPEKEPEYDR